MSIKEVLLDYAVQCLEEQIILEFDPRTCREHPCLLSVRKDIINHYMLQRQEELLPDIVAFNDALREALREALRKMYNEAMAVYEANKAFGEYVSVEARCYLSSDYPTLHPVQTENRQELWYALQDSGWNLLYDDGITFPLRIDNNYNETFDDWYVEPTAQLERRSRPRADQRSSSHCWLPPSVRPHRFRHHRFHLRARISE